MKDENRLKHIRRTGAAITIGILVRLALAPWFHGFQYDMYIYGNWAQTLIERPLLEFYQYAESPDHLPGDLYIHVALAHAFRAFGGQDFFGPEYRFLLKAFPALVDALLVYLAYRFVQLHASPVSSRKIVPVLMFAPAIVFLSAVWGQWDNLSMTLFMAGLLLMWGNRPRPVIASCVFAWMLLIKPPLMLLVLPAVVGRLLWDYRSHRNLVALARCAAMMTASATATITLLMRPFDMVWIDRWGSPSLQGQLSMAADLYPFTTLGAANIWMIPIGAPDRVSDTSRIFGVSINHLGMLLLILACAWISYQVWEHRVTPGVLVWSMAAASYAYFLLPTRSHERYLFPAIILLAILAAMGNWSQHVSTLFTGASITYFLNLLFVYRTPPGLVGDGLFVAMAISNVVIFAYVLMLPRTKAWTTSYSPAAEVRTAPESRPAA